MPGPRAALRFALLFLIATVGPPGVFAEGNVGCLFSQRLCLEELEFCYDDFAFGKCLPSTGNIDDEDLHRYDLDRETLHVLSRELRRLFALGYRWSHSYTQCRLQGMLYAFQNDLPFEENTCYSLVDQDLEGALKALEGEDQQVDPEKVAIIKFTPSAGNPHADYADEVYFPPSLDANAKIRDIILPPDAVDEYDMPDPYAPQDVKKRNWIQPFLRENSPESLEFLQQNYDAPQLTSKDADVLVDYLSKNGDLERLIDAKNLKEILENFGDADLENNELTSRFTSKYNTPDNFRAGWESRDESPESRVYYDEEEPEVENDYDRKQVDSDKVYRELKRLQEESVQNPSGLYTEGGVIYVPDSKIDDMSQPEEELTADEKFKEDLDELLERYNLGFKRPERLDVKKPGPLFDTLPRRNHPLDPIIINGEEILPSVMKKEPRGVHPNPSHEFQDLNLDFVYVHFKQGINTWLQGESILRNITALLHLEPGDINHGRYPKYISSLKRTRGESRRVYENSLVDEVDKNGVTFKVVENSQGLTSIEVARKIVQIRERLHRATGMEISEIGIGDRIKQQPIFTRKMQEHFNHLPEFEDVVNTDFVYVQFKQSISTWLQGESIIRNITELLQLDPSVISHGRVDKNEVTFKVGENPRGLNATEVAQRIEQIKDRLHKATGMEITAAGVGDRIKLQTVFTRKMEDPTEFYAIALLLTGICVAFLFAVCILLVIRRHLISREKLHGITRPDAEASKDYQDLCRARMAGKTQQTTDTVHGRITSLSRESEQSPSSRSSTSSWSEEPALHNMDISTGHMVLSYMEDHLKNKDRLEQEWVALCAYEAEPCASTVALKKENVEKNRYREVLPYDHARVVLNDLSNISGSDYINASSITDHDPRNPAYIAAQGPLPHTASDFWQLIWEQGAVVIVMLTRLTEGGNAMCHRYWPEEGSELYHVYEVHLVSEHIWCDDYLVRSFYLKNTRTGETRTVTQFHFLSWPESGIPSSTKALLEFRRKVNKSYRGRSCPIVVHCSDGAGRTGTYCLIDMVLSRMAKGAKEIDIAATLEHLRDQRPRMVATKQQFEFVLTAVAEEVHAILKALPPQTTPSGPQQDKEK